MNIQRSKCHGVIGLSSFTLDDLIIERCGCDGVVARGVSTVARCNNVIVRQCGWSGIVADGGASITLVGPKTSIHGNCGSPPPRVMSNQGWARRKNYGLKVRNLKEPFTMYLPFPTANRAKKKGVILWVVEKLSGAGFYPISGIIDANINDYMNGELHISSAEDVLVCELPFRSSRWSFAGGIDNLRARGGARFILFILFYIYSKIFWSHRS
jgi:hypothetical protein